MTINFKDKVIFWFKREWGGSLFLPDGWFGKPYDNQHSLTSLRKNQDSLEIVLDNHLKLTFHDLKHIDDLGRELCFRDFSSCYFSWQDCAKGNKAITHSTEYDSGKIKILAHWMVNMCTTASTSLTPQIDNKNTFLKSPLSSSFIVISPTKNQQIINRYGG